MIQCNKARMVIVIITMSAVIGTPGVKWGEEERARWFSQANVVQRSYHDDVLVKVEKLKEHFDVEHIGTLSYDEKYKLHVVATRDWDASKPTILVTGGVHGYEWGGVHGALAFLENRALSYVDRFNIIVNPCISPWGYETINRWTPNAVDPNRTFSDGSSEEAAAMLKYLAHRREGNPSFRILAHFDLHETTDSDATTFRPALFARDGRPANEVSKFIPDGFYLVGNSLALQPEFQTAIIEEVRKVTHIAPPDANGNLISTMPLVQEGLVQCPAKELGLCMGLTDAEYVTTTEMYPDGQNITPAQCVAAQVAVVVGGLEYLSRIQS